MCWSLYLRLAQLDEAEHEAECERLARALTGGGCGGADDTLGAADHSSRGAGTSRGLPSHYPEPGDASLARNSVGGGGGAEGDGGQERVLWFLGKWYLAVALGVFAMGHIMSWLVHAVMLLLLGAGLCVDTVERRALALLSPVMIRGALATVAAVVLFGVLSYVPPP